jgi:hypothetical protein
MSFLSNYTDVFTAHYNCTCKETAVFSASNIMKLILLSKFMNRYLPTNCMHIKHEVKNVRGEINSRLYVTWGFTASIFSQNHAQLIILVNRTRAEFSSNWKKSAKIRQSSISSHKQFMSFTAQIFMKVTGAQRQYMGGGFYTEIHICWRNISIVVRNSFIPLTKYDYHRADIHETCLHITMK